MSEKTFRPMLTYSDEAHHIAAHTWSTVKYKLKGLKCLQFTATPYRNDGKKIDGDIIYNFPLAKAQEQGYFQTINFKPIYEFDEEQGDIAIANAAVAQLEEDLFAEYNHLILVRAKDKKSANELYKNIYAPNFGKYHPVLIHSDISPNDKAIAIKALENGASRIVVCVDMFGEGIDIPGLKIAAVHDKYKSLPITLQFIGRFARTQNGLGNATVITNVANDELNESLQELYAQDSDWNILLNVLSDKEIDKEISLQNFAKGFDKDSIQGITIPQLRPKISMEAYRTESKRWHPKALQRMFDPDKCFVMINSEDHVIVIIERTDSKVEWTSFKGIADVNWDLHLVYWNEKKRIVYINSTNKSISKNISSRLFSDASIIKGEQVFRCLHGIKRLMLGTIGLRSALDGPIRFRMFAGIDIGNGISESQQGISVKSNLFGIGYNGHGKMSIGCSYKGRIWSRWVESIDFWMKWCDDISTRLLDEKINTSSILKGALIPKVINERPKSAPYEIEWPIDLDTINDDSYYISNGIKEYSIYDMDIRLSNNNETGPIRFKVGDEENFEEYELRISDNSYFFVAVKSEGFVLRKNKHDYKMTDFFQEFQPVIKFVNQSMLLEGNVLVELPPVMETINRERLIKWNWTGVDIRRESQGIEKEKGTIQYHLIAELKETGRFSVIFDDDGAGEIADVIAFIDEGEKIIIQFYHCKYSHGDEPGARISDLYEVCGQAEKSVKWCQDPRKIIDRLIKREYSRSTLGGTRFEVGNLRKLKEIKNKMRVYKTKIEIAIVQPGIDKTVVSDDMLRLISGTDSFLLDTYGIKLQIICS